MYLEVKENSRGKVYIADVQHSHHVDIQANSQVSDEVIQKINELEDLAIKPRKINKSLAKGGMDPVDHKWLKNYLAKIRKSKRNGNIIFRLNKINF